jgi:hypothetical protein
LKNSIFEKVAKQFIWGSSREREGHKDVIFEKLKNRLIHRKEVLKK